MKSGGLLHGELSKIVAELGHGQSIVIADYGLPVPAGVQWIDLAISQGVPSFLNVLDAVLSELLVESFTVAEELKAASPDLLTKMTEKIGKVPQMVSHEELKRMAAGAKAIVRTGEWTPYANAVLRAGVVF